jgi:ubiquinone/menaquinone biosynthesis C-methylase UbiE
MCKHGSRKSPENPKEPLEEEQWRHIYVWYGAFQRAEELQEYESWLMETTPFLVEVERSIISRWIQKGKVLPKEIAINGRSFTRIFDRYYFGAHLVEKEIEFIFDYMAHTYEADIDYDMNLDVNIKLIESIATFVDPSKPAKIVDYGVGTGMCAKAIPDSGNDEYRDWGIVGLDLSKLMVDEARRKIYSREENPNSILWSVHQIGDMASFQDSESFNAAMACFAVQYFLDLRPYREIHRLLKPGAPFVCNALKNEIHRVENRAENVGLVPQRKRRQQLGYEVRTQPVVLLAFIKEPRTREL